MIKIKVKGTSDLKILIGTGYGMYKAQGQKGWGSFPSTDEGESKLLVLCDKYGNIEWVNSDKCEVVEIDGKQVKDCY